MALGLPASGNSSGESNGKGDPEQGDHGDENEDGGEGGGHEEDVPMPKRVDMVKFEVCVLFVDMRGKLSPPFSFLGLLVLA